jgi:alpha-ketoglutarate-dependent 2,4-dichlorophenoxyacetate dioxygenase
MALNIRALKPGSGFAGEVTGIDLRKRVGDADFEAISEAFHRYAVLVLRDQDINDEQQVAFSERFGPLETSLGFDQYGGVTLPQISRIANVGDDDKIRPHDHEKSKYHRGNSLWHTDSSFKPIPANASHLSGREVPPVGGETEFADARAAYDAWPGSVTGITKEDLEDLICEHWIVFSRTLIVGDIFTEADKKRLEPVRQALVRAHPVTGRKVFYVGSHCRIVEGWDFPKSRALINELTSWITRPEFVYAHKWRPKDLVMWDNRSVLHRGNPWPDEEYRRVMHRTTVAGDSPSVPLAAE